MTGEERQEERKKVKAALEAAGMTVKVRHGTHGWLKIEVVDGPPLPPCELTAQGWRERFNEVLRVAQEATGRSGEHNGRISITL